MIIPIDGKNISYDRKFQSLCRKPFQGHAKGCPNYGKKEGCPPNQPMIYELLDLSSYVYVIYTEFPVGEFAERMRINHPKWYGMPREWYNPRRWHPVARKEHAEDVAEFFHSKPECIVTGSPEANGVNLTETMKHIDVYLDWQWPPRHSLVGMEYLNNVSFVISIGGYPV